MNLAANRKSTGRASRRMTCTCGALLAVSALGLTFGTGCSDAVSEEFRAAASGQLETGLKAILDGIVTGIFTVATPETTTTTDTSDTSS